MLCVFSMGVLSTTGCCKSKSPSSARVVAPAEEEAPQPSLPASDHGLMNIIHFNEEMPAHSAPGLLAEQGLFEIVAVEFEIFGTVQGVNFREYTKEQADRLGLRGWCENTVRGTVIGRIEGPEDNIETMMNWLQNKGSPASKIQKAEFRNHEDIAEYTFEDFTIRR